MSCYPIFVLLGFKGVLGMTKVEILRAVTAKCSEFNQAEVNSVIEAFSEVVYENLAANKDDKVPFGKLGNFKVKHVPEKSGTIRIGDNKGGTWTKPEHDELIFKVSSTMKDI